MLTIIQQAPFGPRIPTQRNKPLSVRGGLTLYSAFANQMYSELENTQPKTHSRVSKLEVNIDAKLTDYRLEWIALTDDLIASLQLQWQRRRRNNLHANAKRPQSAPMSRTFRHSIDR